jgi:hypothetical protein
MNLVHELLNKITRDFDFYGVKNTQVIDMSGEAFDELKEVINGRESYEFEWGGYKIVALRREKSNSPIANP